MTIEEQIITSKEPYVLVNASAAAGKTYCITERVKFLRHSGVPANSIVVITFTNMAAEEMRERLGDEKEGIFIGTIHSYINYLLLIGGIYTGQILEEENFDELFNLIKENPSCVKPIQHLLLDEAQDTDEIQWSLILEILKPYNWTFVGDTRQAIYEWRGATPEIFENLMKRQDVAVYDLLYNHRNGSYILNYAKKKLYKASDTLEDNSFAISGQTGKVIEISYDEHDLIEMIRMHNEYNFKDWFILTRDNKQLDKIYKALQSAGVPCDTFKRADLTHTELIHKMKEDTVKVLTIHSAKGLEAKAVIVIGAKTYNESECRVSYVAATRAKELLIWVSGQKKNKKKVKSKTDIINWE